MKRDHLAFLAALLFSSFLLHAADPFLGRWALDTKRSIYRGTLCPKRMTIEMMPAPTGVHYHSETELSNGMTYSADYTAMYNGNPVMVSRAKGVLLPVTLRRVTLRVVVATYTSGFETRATSRRVISADGAMMTLTTTSRDGTGKAL